MLIDTGSQEPEVGRLLRLACAAKRVIMQSVVRETRTTCAMLHATDRQTDRQTDGQRWWWMICRVRSLADLSLTECRTCDTGEWAQSHVQSAPVVQLRSSCMSFNKKHTKFPFYEQLTFRRQCRAGWTWQHRLISSDNVISAGRCPNKCWVRKFKEL